MANEAGLPGEAAGIPIQNWSCQQLATYLRSKGHPEPYIQSITQEQEIDGKSLLLLTEEDLKSPSIGIKTVGEVKRLYFDILELQQQECLLNPRISSLLTGHPSASSSLSYQQQHHQQKTSHQQSRSTSIDASSYSSHQQPSTKRRHHHRRQVTFDHDQTTSDESQLEELIEAKLVRKRRPLLQNSNSSAEEDTETFVSLLRSRNNGGNGQGSSTREGGSSISAGAVGGGGSDGNAGIGGGSKTSSPHHQGSIDSSRRTSSTTSSSRCLKPEFSKALLAMGYVFVVTWITALVMVIVHDRVPDMEKYPPLPDLFLDNMPHIPWAFEMCEVTGTILFSLWLGVLFFHKHRMILLRRFFALSGTVFLLRCVTMLITSLSVPGTHLKCNPRPYGDWTSRLYNAYLIWKGAGMSIQGVRTCGDYMFSGHTVALTMLNFFVTEYTTRRLYFVHTFSWLLNTFGIFFILAAHEHYSIDVFIAFYITSRLFLYYHTLANNQALFQRDSKRTKIWFPLFSYFESGVDGPVPNLYEWPITFRRIKILLRELVLVIETKWRGKFFNEGGIFRGRSLFIRPNTGSPSTSLKIN